MAFNKVLAQIGFTVAKATAIVNERIMELEDFVTFTHSDIKTFFKHLASRGMHPLFGAQHKFQIK